MKFDHRLRPLAIMMICVWSVTAAGSGTGRDREVFAECVTVDDEPLMIMDISKVAGDDGRESAFVTMHVRHDQTRTWISKTVAGEVMDLGRDPICEVYRFGGGAVNHIEEISVCFERHEDGTYAGYFTRRDASGDASRHRLACVYP